MPSVALLTLGTARTVRRLQRRRRFSCSFFSQLFLQALTRAGAGLIQSGLNKQTWRDFFSRDELKAQAFKISSGCLGEKIQNLSVLCLQAFKHGFYQRHTHALLAPPFSYGKGAQQGSGSIVLRSQNTPPV